MDDRGQIRAQQAGTIGCCRSGRPDLRIGVDAGRDNRARQCACPQGKSAIDGILTARFFRQFRLSAKFVSAGVGSKRERFRFLFRLGLIRPPVTADDRRARCGLSVAESRLLTPVHGWRIVHHCRGTGGKGREMRTQHCPAHYPGSSLSVCVGGTTDPAGTQRGQCAAQTPAL